jgi:hypothetical protein
MITLRPDSGGLIELELYQTEAAEPGDEPSIMVGVTAREPQTQHFALSPETARRFALALLEQVDAYERWKAEQ